MQQGIPGQLNDEVDLGRRHQEGRRKPKRTFPAVNDAEAVFAQVFLGAVFAVTLEAFIELAAQQQSGTLDEGNGPLQFIRCLLEFFDELMATINNVLAQTAGVSWSKTAAATSSARGLLVIVLP